MAGERAAFLRKQAQDAMTAAMREVEETGELRHLQGQRLDLSDDSPDWFVNRLLKREGVAPPAVERAKDLDAAQAAAAAIVERLQQRRAWLLSPEARCMREDAQAFNERRTRDLQAYREALHTLNRAILTFNLTAPAPLHRHGYIVDKAVADAATAIPALDESQYPTRRTSHRESAPSHSLWRRLRRAWP